MGEIKRQSCKSLWIAWTITAVLSLALITVVFVFITSRLSFSEMDWNEDGTRTLGEILQSIDIGKQLVIRNDIPCIRYFRLKDATEIKMVCSKP